MARSGRKPGTPKTGGRDWKPGQSGNPIGTTKEDHELRKIRHITKDQIKDILSLIAGATHEEMEAILEKPETTALTMMIVKIYMTIAEKGDMHAFDVLLNRVIGKVKDELDITLEPYIVRYGDQRIEMGLKKKGSE